MNQERKSTLFCDFCETRENLYECPTIEYHIRIKSSSTNPCSKSIILNRTKIWMHSCYIWIDTNLSRILRYVTYFYDEAYCFRLCQYLVWREIVPVNNPTTIEYYSISLELIADRYIEEVTCSICWINIIIIHYSDYCLTSCDRFFCVEFAILLEETLIVYEGIEEFSECCLFPNIRESFFLTCLDS